MDASSHDHPALAEVAVGVLMYVEHLTADQARTCLHNLALTAGIDEGEMATHIVEAARQARQEIQQPDESTT